MKKGILALTVVLTACASNSGVIPAGNDSFMIAKQAATGFPGLGNMKAEALQEASQHCANDGKSFDVLSSNETKPPYLLGNYPRVEIQFRCVPKRSS